MTLEQLVTKQQLTELANKLFMYTDARAWDLLQKEVFEKDVWFDMSSAGGGAPGLLPAEQICSNWQTGLHDLDAIHHQAGHYLINIQGPAATIFGYASAWHYKKDAAKGQTRIFVGSYDLKAVHAASGWRISQFVYNLKFIDGNTSLE